MKKAVLFFLFLISACALKGQAPSARNGGGSSSTSTRMESTETIPNPRGIDFSKAPEKIAFGSGADQNEAQPIWKSIVEVDPDLFISTGDLINADKPEQSPLAEQYRKLDKVPGYREAREKIPFMAIWNDGEFGTDDGGADASSKAQGRKEFLNYFRYVKDSVPLGREGIYHSKMIGGQVTGKRRKRVQGPTVQVIMLDTRSFRSPLKKANDAENPLHRYEPNTDKSATILGSEQWEWLEDQLRKPADLQILVSPIQVIADGHGFEKWGNFPNEKDRLFNLIKKTNVKNLIFVSGDRHLGSIAKTDLKAWGTVYEVTASSLNKPSNLQENDKAYLAPAYPNENFGLISIDWTHKRARLELHDIEGKPFQKTEVKLR